MPRSLTITLTTILILAVAVGALWFIGVRAEPSPALPATASAGYVTDHLIDEGVIDRQADGTIQVDSARAAAILAEIPVEPATQATPYDRDAFGPAWSDTDHNGCDTRNDILARDLTDPTFASETEKCIVLAGHLVDVYTDASIDFRRGNDTSSRVQIDHVIPLSYAWRHGADTWSAAQRLTFANDPYNLQAVDGPTNQEKSDSGPSDWMPPSTTYHCVYAARFVSLLASYRLSTAVADRDTLRDTLSRCG